MPALAPNLFLASSVTGVLSTIGRRGIGTVICRQCESKPGTGCRGVSLGPAPSQELGTGLRELLCDACGAVLRAGEADEFLLRRLSQFARFGIGAESAPLLTNMSRSD
jgi:hypothetical protein